MSNAHHNNSIAFDPITNDIGADEGELAYSRPWHLAATIWKISQALSRLDECLCQGLSRLWIKGPDVPPDLVDIRHRGESP
jgi:hypothetical protein